MATEFPALTERRGLASRALSTVLMVMALSLILAACGEIDPRADQRFAPGAAPQGRILFSADGDIHLWDGNISRLTDVGDASSPSWSNGGDKFVFVRTGYAISDLYLANADGRGLVQLTDNQPAHPMGTEIYAINSVWALDPVFSPVTDTIAFVSDLGTMRNVLWLMRGRGNTPERVEESTFANENIEQPDFSPDGTEIVYTQRTAGDDLNVRWTELWVIDLTTGERRPIAESPEGSYDAAWSPDGDWIAFVQRSGGDNDLWVVPSEGGNAIRLTEGLSIGSPAWSPDGQHIAFIEEDGGSFKVSYVQFNVPDNDQPFVSSPQNLFSAGHIHAPSGLSWAP